ncbi:hypothetical protein FRC07_015060, partial [Ceratobasidium sp. 392]
MVVSPTCDNCRRTQNTSRGNAAAKQCTYDRAPEDERWEHWCGTSSKDQQLIRTTNSPPRTSPDGPMGGVEAREMPAARPPLIPTPVEPGFTPLLPAQDPLRSNYDSSATPYPVDLFDNEDYFMAYANNPRSPVSMRGYSSQSAFTASPPELINSGTLAQMMFHPDHNQ